MFFFFFFGGGALVWSTIRNFVIKCRLVVVINDSINGIFCVQAASRLVLKKTLIYGCFKYILDTTSKSNGEGIGLFCLFSNNIDKQYQQWENFTMFENDNEPEKSSQSVSSSENYKIKINFPRKNNNRRISFHARMTP